MTGQKEVERLRKIAKERFGEITKKHNGDAQAAWGDISNDREGHQETIKCLIDYVVSALSEEKIEEKRRLMREFLEELRGGLRYEEVRTREEVRKFLDNYYYDTDADEEETRKEMHENVKQLAMLVPPSGRV